MLFNLFIVLIHQKEEKHISFFLSFPETQVYKFQPSRHKVFNETALINVQLFLSFRVFICILHKYDRGSSSVLLMTVALKLAHTAGFIYKI